MSNIELLEKHLNELQMIDVRVFVVTVARGCFRRADTVKAKAARGRGVRARASQGKPIGIVLKMRAEPRRRGRGV